MTENDMSFAFVSIKKVLLEHSLLMCLCIVCCHIPTVLAEFREVVTMSVASKASILTFCP